MSKSRLDDQDKHSSGGAIGCSRTENKPFPALMELAADGVAVENFRIAGGQGENEVRMPERPEQNIVGTGRGLLVAPLLFLTPLATSAAYRLTWLFFPLMAVALIVPYLRRGNDWRHLFWPITDIVPVLLVAAYVLLGALWAVKPSAAVEKSALLLAVTLIAFAASRAIGALDEPRLSQAARAFAIGAFIGALFVLFELLTDGAITRLVANTGSWFKPEGSKHAKILDGEVTKFKAAEFRQSTALLAFHLWPALLALSAVAGRARRATWIVLLVVAISIPILLSDRMSSQLALVSSLIVFSLAYIWRRTVVHVLAALWCLGFVLVLPAAFLAYKADLHLATWVPKSARARMIIWEFTAERVLERPWLGIGAGSTPALRVPRGEAEQPEGFVVPRTTGAHAHNLFLQTWYELGLVGAILVAIAGALLALRISLLPVEAQPFAAATFTVFLATVSTSWGMWQAWLICGVGLMLLYLLIAARRAR
jgi:O-antigen ligase